MVALAHHADDDAADAEPTAEEGAKASDDGRGPAGESRQAQVVSMVKKEGGGEPARALPSVLGL